MRKTYTKSELQEIFRLHKLWLKGKPGGVRANLSGVDLSEVDLLEADLREADLSGVDLSGANLLWANLSGANFSGADLRGANLFWANLSEANFSGVDLRGANLLWANLSGADLKGANLNWADLDWADLSQIKGIKTFRHGRHQAIQYRDRIRIGCENHTINFWLENYESVGQANDYTPGQIEAYGEFIKLCAKENPPPADKPSSNP